MNDAYAKWDQAVAKMIELSQELDRSGLDGLAGLASALVGAAYRSDLKKPDARVRRVVEFALTGEEV